MKIKKLCTYENLQLQNADGSRPKGVWSRLSKTFTDDMFNIILVPGIGAKITSKDPADGMCAFIVPFANIPYIVAENESDEDTINEARNIVSRRRAKKASPLTKIQGLSESTAGSDTL